MREPNKLIVFWEEVPPFTIVNDQVETCVELSNVHIELRRESKKLLVFFFEKWKINVESRHKSQPLEKESLAAGGPWTGGYKKILVDIAMGGLQYDDPLLCICAIVIAFDRKLNFLYSEKAYTSKAVCRLMLSSVVAELRLYLYKDKLFARCIIAERVPIEHFWL